MINSKYDYISPNKMSYLKFIESSIESTSAFLAHSPFGNVTRIGEPPAVKTWTSVSYIPEHKNSHVIVHAVVSSSSLADKCQQMAFLRP